ncbi:MAG: ribosome biogenesis GTP-binding protein YihA/YsxC [Alphaproteobacteria bacterium]|nr:ribosome biogenesis GTP-binding protein YihA/YsxC [Alphaproteobacteria bacterium]
MATGLVIDDDALKKGEKLFRQDCRFIMGAQKPADMFMADTPEIAFVGRSNVGKSSLVNALTGRKTLARTSSTPGRTQQINFFELGEELLHLVDLPGYGYAVASKTKIEDWNALMRHYLTSRRTLSRVCVLIDGRHGIRAADQDMMEMLDETHVPFLAVLTKCDKVKGSDMDGLKARIGDELKNYGAAFPEIYATASLKGEGIPELRAALALLSQVG